MVGYIRTSDHWPILFCEERDALLTCFTGEHPTPKNNMAKRRKFWIVPAVDSDILNMDFDEDE
jgi:hypothetical protein